MRPIERYDAHWPFARDKKMFHHAVCGEPSETSCNSKTYSTIIGHAMDAMTTNSKKVYDMRSIESGNTTIIEPSGELTPALSHDLHETVRHAARGGRNVEISMRRVAKVSWAGLLQLASTLGEGRLENVRFRGVLPRVRSLMKEVGFETRRIVD